MRVLCLRILLPLLLLGLAYASGWHAYVFWHSKTRRFDVSISFPTALPPGYTVISLPTTAETARFVVGDRVDVLGDYDGCVRPFITDALVFDNTSFFTLLIPHERDGLLWWATSKQIKLQFRRTTALDLPNEEELQSALSRRAVDWKQAGNTARP